MARRKEYIESILKVLRSSDKSDVTYTEYNEFFGKMTKPELKEAIIQFMLERRAIRKKFYPQ